MRLSLTILLWCVPALAAAADPPKLERLPMPAEVAVAAVFETTLSTATGQIRQFAFDGDAKTYFASAKAAAAGDHFTLVFDEPVVVKAIAVTTGRPDGGDRLNAGALEVSGDGKKFEPVAAFTEGAAKVRPDARKIQAVRIRPPADGKHPLVVREFAIDSDPPIAIFKYPIEVVVDVTDASEMKEWADRVARICERAYPMICVQLMSDGFKPRTVISMTLRNDYNGVAAAGGGRITGSVKYFKSNPQDVGAMVHETAHCVQAYRGRGNPGWLVEGVADYVRFFKFEPARPKPLSPNRARYNGSYRVTAAFLAYLIDQYDWDIVRQLNKVMRDGEYQEAIFQKLTGKTVQELDEEWRKSLSR